MATGRRVGRPTKLSQVVRTRADGTPVTAAEHLIERLSLGMAYSAAADSTGVDRVTLHRWRVAGARLRADEAQGILPEPTDEQVELIEFCNACERAEADVEAGCLGVIHRAMRGGATTKTVTEKHDGEGNLLERTTVTKELEPLWTPAGWLLERRFGFVKRYEVTGAEGAPLVPAAEQARGLAEGLRAYLEGHDDGRKAATAITEEASSGSEA